MDVDLFVIGGGSGGLAAAKRAAAHGARVVLAEDSRVGGTCVIRGCVPKKLMAYAAQMGRARSLAADFGWPIEEGALDWPRMCSVRDGVVDRLEVMHRKNLAKAGVRLIEGRATLLADGRGVDVALSDGGEVQIPAKHVLLAPGAEPVLPAFAGAEHAITSDALFGLKTAPKSVVVVGAGYIAVEFVCILHGLGVSVDWVVRGEVLRGFDRATVALLVTQMQARGVRLHQGYVPERLEAAGSGADEGYRMHLVRYGDAGDPKRKETQELSTSYAVLSAVGRKPKTANLGLAEAGVATDAQGHIQINAEFETALPHVLAVGDAVGLPNLTPLAIRCGRAVAEKLFAGKPSAQVSTQTIATAIFSVPPIGTVGLSEEAACAQFGEDDVQVFSEEYVPLFFSGTPAERKGRSLVRMVVQRSTDKVLGCHMLGEDAPEIIQGIAIAVTAGMTKADFDATLAVHPTQAEEFVLLR